MTLLQQLVFQAATDDGSRAQLQARAITTGLTQEEQAALSSLGPMLALSPDELLHSVKSLVKAGWIWPEA